MEIWIATGNKGKVSEFKLLLQELNDLGPLEIHTQNEIKAFTPRPEDGKTFEDNARIKAKSLKAVKPGVWVIADDSGLEVTALGGLPGVHSARYAGPKASDSENVAKLLKMMLLKNAQTRSAQFVCSLVIYSPTGEEFVLKGELKGTIASKPLGQHGFGYDPIFIPEGQNQTLAELGAGFKTTHSHRAIALKQFIQKIKGEKS